MCSRNVIQKPISRDESLIWGRCHMAASWRRNELSCAKDGRSVRKGAKDGNVRNGYQVEGVSLLRKMNTKKEWHYMQCKPSEIVSWKFGTKSASLVEVRDQTNTVVPSGVDESQTAIS
jgi:hypothetical protein